MTMTTHEATCTFHAKSSNFFCTLLTLQKFTLLVQLITKGWGANFGQLTAEKSKPPDSFL